jgi:CrcB protein
MQQVLAICLGACLGALSRWKLGLWLNTPGALPWGTLAANAIGGYLIGLCVGFFQAHPGIDPVWRLLLVTGFLGALTTFSSFSAEVVELLQQGRWSMAFGWAAAHLAASLLLTIAGIATVK